MRTAVMKRLGKAKEDQKGFTLIELLAVIVILAVIAAIAIPLIGNIINKSKEDSDISTARQIYDASRIYVTSELDGDFKNSKNTSGNLEIPIVGTPASGSTQAVDGLQTKGYLDKNLVLPSTKHAITGGKVVYQRSDGALLYVQIVSNNETVYYKGSDVLKNEGKSTKDEPTAP